MACVYVCAYVCLWECVYVSVCKYVCVYMCVDFFLFLCSNAVKLQKQPFASNNFDEIPPQPNN